MDINNITYVENEAELKALYPAPLTRATNKVLDHLDKHCRSILELSPFCVLSTQGPNGADVSPRGDPPGFLRVIDDKTLLLPDRVGNNRLDALANLFTNPQVGLLVIVPGMGETLRINGTARITNDEAVLAESTVRGITPKVGLVVSVQEAFLHCPKAFIRSRLWDATAHIDRASLPSYPQMLLDHVNGLTAEENDRQTKVMSDRGLY